MAEIFLAALHGDAGFEKRVVVKRILPHLSADAGFVKMFIDEAVLAARLAHPNIVQVYDFGSIAGSYYIAMEHIDGVDLHHMLRGAHERGRRLTSAEVASLGEGISRGLAYTHNLQDDAGAPLGIVHRDVSPHNLMLSKAGDPKVMDFGIAKAAARFSRTATGTIKGKLAYMAPEQASGHGADKRSDQFSLGVVLWECLAGQRLFVSDTEVSLMQAVIACDIPPLRNLRPDVPEALANIIERALARDPAARFPDLSDMEAELTAFRFGLGEGGIVHLGELAEEFASSDTPEGPDWSWAEGMAPGTRPMPLRPALQAEAAPTARPTEFGSSPGGHITPTPRPARRRTASARLALRYRDPVAAAAGSPAPARQRTTWRINRPVRRAWQRPLTVLGGVALMFMGIGVPLLMWPNLLDNSNVLAATYRRQMRQVHLSLGNADDVRGTGKLSLRTDGPAVDVYLGSAHLGTTPLSNEDVPAGKLQLRLVNEAVGIVRNYEIFVPEGGSAQGVISSP